MTPALQEKIARLQELLGQRTIIDEQLAEILGDSPEPIVRKYKKHHSVPDKPHRGKKSRFTEAEQRNVIELYNRGESATAIGKLFGRTPASMSTYLWNLKRKGLIEDRPPKE